MTSVHGTCPRLVSPIVSWDEIAQQLLDAATGSGVSVARSFIAPGPSFARDCRSIVVAMLRPATVPLQREWAGSCGIVPQHTFQVIFVADCVPVARDGVPPTADALTAWSTAFLADAGKIHDAILDAATDGSIAGGCHQVSIGQGEMRGPLGTTASMIVPVTVTLIDG